MSDAPGVSEQSDTAPLPESVAAADTTRGHRGWLVRLLATVGAAVFAYAVWLPWAIVMMGFGGRRNAAELVDPNVAFTSHLVKLGGFAPTSFEVAAFSVLGLLLAPLLWRPADSLLGAIATHIFGLWLLFATVFVVAFGISPLVSGKPQPLPTQAPLASALTMTGQLAPGFWLAAAALVPMWIAVIGLLFSEWRRHAFWHLPGGDSDDSRSLIQLPGAAVLNLGLIVWAIGFLSLGWAAFNCTQTPLLLGSCQGAPASSALFAGISQAIDGLSIHAVNDPQMLLMVDPNIARNAIGILLAGGAVLIFLGVWLRAVTRVFCIWTTLWLIAAVALAGLAASGVSLLIANPTRYELSAGAWSTQSGVFVTLLGLIIALVGLATVSAAALRRKGE